jgi:hypothetical protein
MQSFGQRAMPGLVSGHDQRIFLQSLGIMPADKGIWTEVIAQSLALLTPQGSARGMRKANADSGNNGCGEIRCLDLN